MGFFELFLVSMVAALAAAVGIRAREVAEEERRKVEAARQAQINRRWQEEQQLQLQEQLQRQRLQRQEEQRQEELARRLRQEEELARRLRQEEERRRRQQHCAVGWCECKCSSEGFPVYVDGQTRLPFCCSVHALNLGHECGTSTCSYPLCRYQVVVARGQELPWCSEKHRQSAGQLGLQLVTPIMEPAGEVDCSFRCGNGFSLNLLVDGSDRFRSVRDQFSQSWGGAGSVAVRRVFKVRVPTDVYRDYNKYLQQKRSGMRLHRLHPGAALMRRVYHGTSAKCHFYTALGSGPCGDADCKVCNICTQGFSLRHGAVGANGSRFGRGMYFAQQADKSHWYNRSTERDHGGEKWRCMFLCSIVIGRMEKTGDATGRNGPAAGYDSLHLQSGGAGRLQHDEIVLYNDLAAIPSYLVVYSTHA